MSDLLLEQVLAEMRGFKHEVLSRMGGLEERMGGLEGRMGGLEERMGGLEERMGGLEERMGGLEERMGPLEKRAGNLEVEVKGIREEHGLLLRQLEERTQVTNAVVTRLAEDVNQLRGEMAAVGKRLAEHDVEIKVLKKAVAG